MLLAEKVMRVRLLLETLNEPYPTPRGALATDSGPAPSRYVPCGACGARGERRERGGWVLCLACDGRGERRSERGEEPWDAYIGMSVAQANELPREPPTRLLIPEAIREATYGWERLRHTYDRHGSYQQVRRELDRLALDAPLRFRLVRAVLVDHEPRQLDARMQSEMDLGVATIALRIKSVRVPPWLLERSRAAERRNTIEMLAADGLSAGEIARRTGIPKRTVRKRLARVKLAPTGTTA